VAESIKQESIKQERSSVALLDCRDKSVRDINLSIYSHMAAGEREILVLHPDARHNLGVALLHPAKVTFAGSVGYYCGGLSDGATVEIQGSAGWGLAESMLSGTVIVEGNAGNGAAAAIRGGTVVIKGDAAARAGVSIKKGLLIVGGSCGYMAGFMGQGGTIIVCGDTGDAFADSMYETICYVGGEIRELGNDAVLETPSIEDQAMLTSTLASYLPANSYPAIGNFKKVVAGRKLWNFDKRDWSTWREAL
jgi:glutamate synthase domain-containing protein 3